MSDEEIGAVCVTNMLCFAIASFFCMGFMQLVTGLVNMVAFNEYEIFLGRQYFINAAIWTAFGVIVFLLSVFGCCAAFKGSTEFINVYAGLVLLLVILEISFTITMIVLCPNTFNDIQIKMNNTISNYTQENIAKRAWDMVQRNLHCCGVDSHSDWADELIRGRSITMEDKIFTVPFSCCNTNQTFCDEIYELGCSEALEHYAYGSSNGLDYCTLTMSIMQLPGVLTPCWLANSLRRAKIRREKEYQESQNVVFGEAEMNAAEFA